MYIAKYPRYFLTKKINMIEINPKLAEFSSPLVSIPEIESFYTLQGISLPSNRPYCWSNSVTSLDGILHFLEENSHVNEIALKHISPGEQLADFRLLSSSWAFSDAILLSGKTIREEEDPGMGKGLAFTDLENFRIQILKKKTKAPVQIILSRSSIIPLNKSLFHNKENQVWIFCTHPEEVKDQMTMNYYQFNEWSDIKVFDYSSEDIAILLETIREMGIEYLDVSAGGSLIRSLIDQGCLDEIRMSQVGHIAGRFNSLGYARPTLFPDNCKSYGPNENPLVSWKGIRTLGDHFVFFRGFLAYRALPWNKIHEKADNYVLFQEKKMDASSILKRTVTKYRKEMSIQKGIIHKLRQIFIDQEHLIEEYKERLKSANQFSRFCGCILLVRFPLFAWMITRLASFTPNKIHAFSSMLMEVSAAFCIYQSKYYQKVFNSITNFIPPKILPPKPFSTEKRNVSSDLLIQK